MHNLHLKFIEYDLILNRITLCNRCYELMHIHNRKKNEHIDTLITNHLVLHTYGRISSKPIDI